MLLLACKFVTDTSLCYGTAWPPYAAGPVSVMTCNIAPVRATRRPCNRLPPVSSSRCLTALLQLPRAATARAVAALLAVRALCGIVIPSTAVAVQATGSARDT